MDREVSGLACQCWSTHQAVLCSPYLRAPFILHAVSVNTFGVKYFFYCRDVFSRFLRSLCVFLYSTGTRGCYSVVGRKDYRDPTRTSSITRDASRRLVSRTSEGKFGNLHFVFFSFSRTVQVRHSSVKDLERRTFSFILSDLQPSLSSGASLILVNTRGGTL